MNRSSSRFLSEPTSTTQLGRPSTTVKGLLNDVHSTIKMSYLRILLYLIVDMNIIDLTQESDCESEDLEYDAGVSHKSSNADVITSSEDVSTDDDSSR